MLLCFINVLLIYLLIIHVKSFLEQGKTHIFKIDIYVNYVKFGETHLHLFFVNESQTKSWGKVIASKQK